MREFARRQTAALLGRLALEINRSAREGGADRFTTCAWPIRRLSRCLRSFSKFYPRRSWKKGAGRSFPNCCTWPGRCATAILHRVAGQGGDSGRAAIVARLSAERAKASRKTGRRNPALARPRLRREGGGANWE